MKKYTTVTIHGQSMYPTLKDGETVLVRASRPEDIKKFDIIVYSKNEQVICHRVVKVMTEAEKRTYYLQGDFDCRPPERVRVEDVVGKVTFRDVGTMFKADRWHYGVFYVFIVRAIATMKNCAYCIIDEILAISLLRAILKRMYSARVTFRDVNSEEDENKFKSFLNYIPYDSTHWQVIKKYIVVSEKKTVGKLLVMKDSRTNGIVMYGPYIKLMYRARGVARRLLDYALEQTEENKNMVSVFVYKGNVKTEKIFRKMGFSKFVSEK